MGSASRVDGVEDSPEVFGCHLVVVFYKSEKGEAEEGVSEDPEVVEEDGEHEVEEADEVVLGGGFWQIGMFLDAVAGFDAPAFSVEMEESGAGVMFRRFFTVEIWVQGMRYVRWWCWKSLMESESKNPRST